MKGNLPPDKKLFTPGPLGCSLATKQAMLRDLGSRDSEFIKVLSHSGDFLPNSYPLIAFGATSFSDGIFIPISM